VEASRGCPPLTHDTAKIDRRKKGKYQPTPQPVPAAEPIRKYQLTEIPQQQEPNNVFANPPPTPDSRPCSSPPQRRSRTPKVAKQTPPAPSRPVEKSFYMSIFFFFDETRGPVNRSTVYRNDGESRRFRDEKRARPNTKCMVSREEKKQNPQNSVVRRRCKRLA
jgi:hypothetical protein